MKRRVTKASASWMGVFIVACCVAVMGLALLRGTNDDEEDDSEATQTQPADEEAAPDDTPTQPPTNLNTSDDNVTATPVCDCSGDLLDCADFTSPQDAQACYTYCLSSVDADVHLLDGDENGVVCETVWVGWATPAVSSTPTSAATHLPTPQPTSAPVCNCSYDAYNCSSFSGHAAAQRCYNYCRELGRGDIHQLDQDSDGSACE
jgi:hypothetical protein